MKFEIIGVSGEAEGFKESFRPNGWAGFKNLALQAMYSNLKCRYLVDGKEVTVEEAIEAAEEEGRRRFEKKNKTHKQVKVLVGVAGVITGNHRTVWVRR